ncbi:MAG: hypothetical protein HN572_12040 [Kordiimonadaceae bacterium]|nr:hypothetical protein [Kordiimonadaceae bacterium]
MSESLYEFLAKNNLMENHSLDETIETVSKWNTIQVEEFCIKISDLLPRSNKPATSPFEFIGTETLGGGPTPCIDPSCRIQRVISLTSFAGLYAEKILIPDPYEIIIERINTSTDINIEVSIQIYITHLLSPLIKSGIICFSESKHHHLCRSCYSEAISKLTGTDAKKFYENINRIEKNIENRFLKDAKYIIDRDNSGYYMKISASEDLIEHGSTYFYPKDTDNALVTQKEKSSLPFELSIDDHRRIAKAQSLTSDILDDLLRQNYYSNIFKTNCLTDIEVQFDSIINFSEGDKDNYNPTPKTFADVFSHNVPIVKNSDVQSLIDLRISERESFEVYRDTLYEALKVSKGSSKKIMQESFDDLVRPEINKIQLTISKHKKKLGKRIKSDVILASGFIGISVFGGILPPNIAAIIGSLGGFHFSNQMLKNIEHYFSEPGEINENNFYFYWKAQNLLNHKE